VENNRPPVPWVPETIRGITPGTGAAEGTSRALMEVNPRTDWWELASLKGNRGMIGGSTGGAAKGRVDPSRTGPLQLPLIDWKLSG